MYSHQGGTQANTQKDAYPQVGKNGILETREWLKLLIMYPWLSYQMENYSTNIPPPIHSYNEQLLGKEVIQAECHLPPGTLQKKGCTCLF